MDAVQSSQNSGAKVELVGTVTFHDSTNGFIHFDIGGTSRCCDDSKIKPSNKFLKRGARIRVVYEGSKVVEIIAQGQS